MNKYISRSLEPVLKKAVSEFPVVFLTGPRQSGKTTLLRQLFGERFRYASLDQPDIRISTSEDPRSFLKKFSRPVIFDEVQHAPTLLPYIKQIIEEDRQENGQYLLAGSQNLLLNEKISESLAGRAAVLKLLPLSRREIELQPELAIRWERANSTQSISSLHFDEMWKDCIRGGYPELVVELDRDLNLWHASYVQTYLERDVRTLRQVGDLTQFQSFIRVLAARSAQLLNLADIARDLGIALNTVKAWLTVLEASYQVMILRPYFTNIKKRLVKTPKVYFMDVGTLCYLSGIKDPEHAALGPMGGAIMETAVLSEIIRTSVHQGIEPQVYFWRTSTGKEVGFVVGTRNKVVPLEVKLSATPHPRMASGIKSFMHDTQDTAIPGYIVHPGDTELPLGPEASSLPFASL